MASERPTRTPKNSGGVTRFFNNWRKANFKSFINQNRKSEGGNPKDDRRPKCGLALVASYRWSEFGIRISFGLRISVFGFSFASQRYRRVHPRCASGRDGRGKQRDGGQDGGVGHENERIGGGDAEQQTVQHACREPGRNQAQDYPYHGGLKANHRDWRTNLPVSLSLSERFFAGSKRGCV